MKVLTEEDLRCALLHEGDSYHVESGAYITSGASSYAVSHGITIVREKAKAFNSGQNGGDAFYLDNATGKKYFQKPEEMTHLSGNRLVKKSDSRISFRGKLDTVEAYIVRLGVLAKENNTNLYEALGELLEYTRNILAAEVKEKELNQIEVLGMDAETLRICSHNRDGLLDEHPVPCARQGLIAAELNLLRAEVREAEVAAVKMLPVRLDIVQALNRLSSVVYILYCRTVAGVYKE